MSESGQSNGSDNNDFGDPLEAMVNSIVHEVPLNPNMFSKSPFPPTHSDWDFYPIPVDKEPTPPAITQTAPSDHSEVTSTVDRVYVSGSLTYNGREIMSCEEDPKAGKCIMTIRLPGRDHIQLQFPPSATFERTREDFRNKVTDEKGLHWKTSIDQTCLGKSKPMATWLKAMVGHTLGAHYDQVNADRDMQYLSLLLANPGEMWKGVEKRGRVEWTSAGDHV
ncbi:uncharacterized protein L203_105816 [Cryptococcus depauperatus CBS 7841]|uniref:Uncharacterized protein n=1 Tax=Cryptococcus depauperatus CBS 7841 TaxID=1295531 RepID=A0A1E3IA45_9TREE|nr:hypothetical protein L203_04962 [Cryptococcus depauperatus CBS 7841]